MMINGSMINNIVISKTHTSEVVAEVLKEKKMILAYMKL